MANENKTSEKQRRAVSALNFGTAEAYKSIRANLNFAIPNKKCRKILFTSAMAGEGKTTTSVNTAITIAQTGAKTVIVDCDLRKARVHRMFSQANKEGVSNVLSGMNELKDVIRETNKKDLNFISAGTIPPNPSELVASTAMEKLLADLEEMFEYIVIDCPPVNVVSDALPIAKLVDGVVLVIKHKVSTYPALNDTIRSLKFAGANIVGAVMNGVDVEDVYSKSKYKYKYRYRYRYYKYSNYSYNYSYSDRSPAGGDNPQSEPENK